MTHMDPQSRTYPRLILTRNLVVASCAAALSLLAACDPDQDQDVFAEGVDPIDSRCAYQPPMGNTNEIAENWGRVNLRHGGFNVSVHEDMHGSALDTSLNYHKITAANCPYGTPPFALNYTITSWNSSGNKLSFTGAYGGGTPYTFTNNEVVGCTLSLTFASNSAFTTDVTTGTLKILGAQEFDVLDWEGADTGTNRWKYNFGITNALKNNNAQSLATSYYALCPHNHRVSGTTAETWAVVRDGAFLMWNNTYGIGGIPDSDYTAITCLNSATGKSALNSTDHSAWDIALQSAAYSLVAPIATAVNVVTHDTTCGQFSCTETGMSFAWAKNASRYASSNGLPLLDTYTDEVVPDSGWAFEALFDYEAVYTMLDGTWHWGYYARARCRGSSLDTNGYMRSDWARTAGTSEQQAGTWRDWDDLASSPGVTFPNPTCSQYIANGGTWALKTFALCRREDGYVIFGDNRQRCNG